MKFDVNYSGHEFYGKGAVYMYDTALILDGNAPKFHIPLLFRIYERVLDVRTSRTIPYSVILSHTIFISNIRITYKVSNMAKQQTVVFKVLDLHTPLGTTEKPGPESFDNLRNVLGPETIERIQQAQADAEKNRFFLARLDEYLTITKSLIGE